MALKITIVTATLLLSLFVLPSLQSPIIGTNMFTVTVVLLLLFGDTNVSLISAAAGGFMFDLVSPYPFGTHAVSLVASIVVVRWFFRTRFTNRSLLAYLFLSTLGLILQPAIALGYSVILSIIDSQSIGMAFDMPAIVGYLFTVLHGVSVSLIIYVAVRLSGRSYVTLSSQEF